MNTNPIIDTLALLAQDPREDTIELRRNLRFVAHMVYIELKRPVPIEYPNQTNQRSE